MSYIRIARNTLCSALILVQTVAFPALSFAQEVAPEASQETTTSESTPAPVAQTPAPGESTTPRGATETGPSTPTGADSSTYVDNGSGSWSNGTYTWNPSTKQTQPNAPQEYSYNPTTGRWDTTQYVFSPETGRYVPNVVSSATNPNASISTTGPGSANQLAGSSPSGASISNTGPNSNNTLGGNTNVNGTFDLFFNGAISNNISSNATSGNSLVQGNTKAGSALTGDASAIANVLNMLQSSFLGQNSEIATFINNIDGNVYGDLLIDPSQLPYALGNSNTNLDINVDNNGVINNNIDLKAVSGDAAVDSNTLAGDATTGSARAMANVINLINSAIHSGKSFLGMININGNLDGDILLPQGMLENLIATTGPNSNNLIGGNNVSNVNATSNTNRTINNNVQTGASSGNALVDQNTSAGSANTGQAQTSTNSLNVAGQNVRGKNGILVFVNIMGKWVGMVVGPANATINNTGPNSNNTIGGDNNNSLTVASNENSAINNNIRVNAGSGDATVSNNTNAGSARSGDASATVNLVNIIGSEINVTDWFGVLFINVFGSWFGNFGADSANGGFSQNPIVTSTGGPAVPSVGSSTPREVFGFVSRNNTTQAGNGFIGDQQVTPDQSNQNQAVIGSTTPSNTDGSTGTSSASTTSPQFNLWLVAGFIGAIATALVLAREYILALREERLAS